MERRDDEVRPAIPVWGYLLGLLPFAVALLIWKLHFQLADRIEGRGK